MLYLQLAAAHAKLTHAVDAASSAGIAVPARITQSLTALYAMLGVAQGFVWPTNITLDSFIASAEQIGNDLTPYANDATFGAGVTDALVMLHPIASMEPELRAGGLATAASFPAQFVSGGDVIVVGAWRASGPFGQYVQSYQPPPTS